MKSVVGFDLDEKMFDVEQATWILFHFNEVYTHTHTYHCSEFNSSSKKKQQQKQRQKKLLLFSRKKREKIASKIYILISLLVCIVFNLFFFSCLTIPYYNAQYITAKRSRSEWLRWDKSCYDTLNTKGALNDKHLVSSFTRYA